VELLARASDLSIGQTVADMNIDFSMEHMSEYEAVVPHYANVHDSVEAASSVGYGKPFASGTMIVAYAIERLLPDVFGDGFIRQGKISCNFTRPIIPGDQVRLSAEIIAKLPHGENTDVIMRLTAALPDGELVAVGSASAIAEG
jgi:acyl dehydratase